MGQHHPNPHRALRTFSDRLHSGEDEAGLVDQKALARHAELEQQLSLFETLDALDKRRGAKVPDHCHQALEETARTSYAGSVGTGGAVERRVELDHVETDAIDDVEVVVPDPEVVDGDADTRALTSRATGIRHLRRHRRRARADRLVDAGDPPVESPSQGELHRQVGAQEQGLHCWLRRPRGSHHHHHLRHHTKRRPPRAALLSWGEGLEQSEASVDPDGRDADFRWCRIGSCGCDLREAGHRSGEQRAQRA